MSSRRPPAHLAAMEAALLRGNPTAAFAQAVEMLQAIRKGSLRAWGEDTRNGPEFAQDAARFVRLYMATVRHVRWDPLRDPALSAFLFDLNAFYALVRLTPAASCDEAMVAQSADFQRARTAADFLKILLLWTPGSRALPDPFVHFENARAVVAAQALAVIAAMCGADEPADRARNAAIGLLCSGRVQPADIAQFIVDNPLFGSAWMRCSYATVPHRHDVKKVLNAALRQVYAGKAPAPGNEVREIALPADDRPRLVVPTEWAFREGGAMHRCYAPVILDLRRRFQVVGLGLRQGSDESTAALFDHFVAYEDMSSTGKIDIACVAAGIRAMAPAMVFYPSVGMIRLVICLANMRLAPVQVMSVGHPATTCSDCIDYVVTERSFVGDPAIFSEHLLPVPDGAMGFDAPKANGSAALRQGPVDDGRFHVAVPAIAHKLSWPFVRALKQAQRASTRPVVFHFFSGMQGLLFHELVRVLQDELPGCVVYPWMEYQDYLDRVDRCHVHAASFPFGGTNSLIDSLRQGIPVVALRGREVHERIDAEFMRRLGLDDALVAGSPEQYAAILARLANDPAELAAVRRRVREEADVAGVLMSAGHPAEFTAALWSVLPDEYRGAAEAGPVGESSS